MPARPRQPAHRAKSSCEGVRFTFEAATEGTGPSILVLSSGGWDDHLQGSGRLLRKTRKWLTSPLALIVQSSPPARFPWHSLGSPYFP